MSEHPDKLEEVKLHKQGSLVQSSLEMHTQESHKGALRQRNLGQVQPSYCLPEPVVDLVMQALVGCGSAGQNDQGFSLHRVAIASVVEQPLDLCLRGHVEISRCKETPEYVTFCTSS